MRYRRGIWIPAGRLASDPKIEVLEVVPGVITEVEINFPAGHSGLTYVQIFYNERQIFPTTPGVAFRGDDTLITFDESWPIREVPCELEILGWAPLTVYPHTVFVSVTILEDKEFAGFFSQFADLPEGFM